ncbi:rhamnulokinase family protein [Actinomycetota bacterium]
MPTKNYLIFDLGASNGRGIVARFDGKKFTMEVIHRFNNVEVLVSGTRYWDILHLYNEILKGIKIAVDKYKNIRSIGIDTWGADCCFLDKNGKLLANPVSYRDEARYEDADKVFEVIPKRELFELTSGPVSPENDLFHLFSQKLKNATEISIGKTYLSISDTLNYLITGKAVNEFTRMTMSILFNQKKRKLEKKILEKMDFPVDWFPTMVQPGDSIGKLSKDVTSELEIDPIEVIITATHDTASAIAGIPVTVDKNWAFISTGTWAILGQRTDKQMVSDEIMEAGFANEGGVEVPNIFMTEMVGLWIIQQCRDRWIKDSGKDISWDKIVEVAENTKPFKAFIDISVEDFAQLQQNMPGLIEKHCKSKGQDIPIGMGGISRCIFESLAMKFKHNFNLMEKMTGQKNEVLYMVGGGIQNKLLCQLTANATGMPVTAGPVESTSVGNLLMQLKGTGEINSLVEGRKISSNSSEIAHYNPIDIKNWNDAYERYLSIL